MALRRATALSEAPRRTDRLFLALIPSPQAAASITALGLRLSADHGLTARPVAPERLHLTLHFLGDHAGLPEALLASACEAASNLRRPQFEVVLDRAASFPRPQGNRPLVLRGGPGIAGVLALHQAIGDSLGRSGVDLPTARPYTPHVTLLYDRFQLSETRVPAISWEARDFVLVRSLIGRGSHEVLERWPLEPAR